MSREENHQNPSRYRMTDEERTGFLHLHFGRGGVVNVPQEEIDRAVEEEETRLAEKLKEVESLFGKDPKT